MRGGDSIGTTVFVKSRFILLDSEPPTRLITGDCAVCVDHTVSWLAVGLHTYLCPSLSVEHRPSMPPLPPSPPTPPPPPPPSTPPRHRTLVWSFRTSWSLAVSALLQCLASNCCKAGLSSSSPAGFRSGLGVWCWMLAS